MNIVIRKLVFACGLLSLTMWAAADADPARGEQLSETCVACHGSDGNSPAPNFPKLAGIGEKYLLKQLEDIRSGEREVIEMAGMLDNFSEQDLADLAAYYNSQTMQLSGAEAMNVQIHTGEQVDALELGQRIYRGGNAQSQVPACTGCHSPQGLGNEPAAYPRLSGQHAQYVEQQLRDYRAGDRTNDTDAQIMRGVAQFLSDAEIIALANYIAGLH